MPENNNKDELRMSDLHNGGVRTNGNGVEGLLRWVRLLLPVAIAGIGWYIGHTVGKFDDALISLDERIDIQEIACASAESEHAVKFSDISRRMEEINAREIRLHADIVPASQYHRDMDRLRDELNALEEKHTK